MASPHALVINALNDAIRASIAKSTKDLLDAISKDYGIDLEELRAKYLADAESAAATTTTKKTTKEKSEKIACAATTKKNKPCRRFSVDGSCYCKLHVRFIAETASPETQKTNAKKTKKKTMNDLVSPDNFKLRKEFDAVFEEIFEEETEDEEAERSEAAEERAAASERGEDERGEDERGEDERGEDERGEERAAAASEPEMDFDDEATEVADDEDTEVADDEVADDEATEVADDEVADDVEVAEEVEEEIMVKFWKDAAAKRPSMRRTLVFDAPATFDRALDRLALDREAADFMDRGFAILSGKNDEVVRDLGETVRDGVINVLARDDDNFADIEWRHLDDMPDLEAFLERALLSSEIEEEEI